MKTLCDKVKERKFDGFLNSNNCKIINKNNINFEIVFQNITSFTLYQIYNEYNKKLNCDRKIIKVEPSDFNDVLKEFKNRTCYLEMFTNENHIQFSFYLCCGNYSNGVWKWNVKVDKMFVDGELITNYNKVYCGKNAVCNLDSCYNCDSALVM